VEAPERFVEVLRDFLQTSPVAPQDADAYRDLLIERAAST
jgi:hypothetical protein